MEICNGVDYLAQVKELIIEYTKRLGRLILFLFHADHIHFPEAIFYHQLDIHQYIP